MVSFVCDACQATLKKQKVDQHCYRCNAESVSCIDCGVAFYGDDYRNHTSCISEAEKYQKKLFKPKGTGNKTDGFCETTDSPKAAQKNDSKNTQEKITKEIPQEEVSKEKGKTEFQITKEDTDKLLRKAFEKASKGITPLEAVENVKNGYKRKLKSVSQQGSDNGKLTKKHKLDIKNQVFEVLLSMNDVQLRLNPTST